MFGIICKILGKKINRSVVREPLTSPTTLTAIHLQGAISMTIYLYVKTHKITGLKYLGQTRAKDPHKYTGSGVYWKLHLDKHGVDYTTEILRECQSKEELKEWGIYYSNLWDVVESDDWANLKVEQGDGGRQSAEVRKRIGEAGLGRVPWNKGKIVWTEEQKIEIGKRRKGTKQSEETITKRVTKNTGKKRTPEQINNLKNGQAKRGPVTEATKNKQSKVRKEGLANGTIKPTRSATWEITDLVSGEKTIIVNLANYCRENNISITILDCRIRRGNPTLNNKSFKKIC